MYKLFMYARHRLFVSEFQREQFLNMIIKRMLKSIARSAGGRITTNKWMKLIDHLYVADPEGKGRELMDTIKQRLQSYARTHKQSCLRITFIMDMIKAHRNGETFAQVLSDYLPLFREQSQESWLNDCAYKQNYSLAGCGHYERSSRLMVLQGSDDDVHYFQHVCRSCGEAEINAGVRVQTTFGLTLSRYAVTVHGRENRTYILDRRRAGISYNEQRQIYHDGEWTPYAGLLNSYHSSRQRGFRVIESPWFKSHRRAFGCELEVQVRTGDVNVAVGKVHEAVNHQTLELGEYCYFERDGSIGTGFEMVTQPAGLDVHADRLGRFLNSPELKRGLRSHEGGACGFHVHVGREFLTQSQIYRIQAFLNDVRNESLVRSIARRYDSNYCRYKPHMAKFTPHNKHSTERYEALNVTNTETVEFRIFRGSLRYESIMAALEFCNALLAFCTPGVTSIMDFTAIGFKKFVMHPSNRLDTKYLRAYLALDQNSRDQELQAA